MYSWIVDNTQNKQQDAQAAPQHSKRKYYSTIYDDGVVVIRSAEPTQKYFSISTRTHKGKLNKFIFMRPPYNGYSLVTSMARHAIYFCFYFYLFSFLLMRHTVYKHNHHDKPMDDYLSDTGNSTNRSELQFTKV